MERPRHSLPPTRLGPGVSRRALVLALGAAIWPLAGRAEPSVPGEPVLLQADHMTYDRVAKRVVAEGHVEASQGQRLVLADRIAYDQASGTVVAKGKVSMVDPAGNVVFADEAELDRSLADGVATSVKLLMADNARLAAVRAQRHDKTIMTLDQAVYSPCNLCAEDPRRAPLWQIKATRVTHDDVAKTISYDDARLEVAGIPVLYTPYFSHPDPSVDRQSGFLMPNIGSSSDLGFRTTIPYLWVIDPSKDLTLAPTYTSLAGYGLLGDYRQRFSNAALDLSGSFLEADKASAKGGTQLRGHLFGYGQMNLGDRWKTGFNLQRATDDTYLRRFGISNATTLTTSAYVERITNSDVFTADGYWFQGLRAQDVKGAIPIVTPLVTYQHYGTPGWLGGRFDYLANFLNIARPSGRNTRRVSGTGSWSLPMMTELGQVMRLTAQVDGDGYWVQRTNRTAAQVAAGTNRLTGRVNPTLTFDWRWPLVRDEAGWRQVAEPIVQVIAAPQIGLSARIPNEDSTTVEFDDTSIFDHSRYAGRDRTESGSRANVGGQWSLYGPNGGQVSMLLGETLRLRPDRFLAREQGLGATRSDYVGRLVIAPSSWFDLVARMRLDPDNFSARRTELQAQGGPPGLRLSVGFLDTDADRLDPTILARRELAASVYARLSDHYYISAAGTRDLTQAGRWVNYSTGFFYTDECFETGIVLARTNVTDRELRPSTALNLIVRLKSLGQTFELPTVGIGSLTGLQK